MGSIVHYLRRLARCMWVWTLEWSGLLGWAERNLHRHRSIVTLTFHRVLTEDSFETTNSLPGIIVREQTFRKVIEYVATQFEVVGLADAAPGMPSPRLRVAVTFDDGWRDNCTIALPILKERQLPATIFVCPGLSGSEAPFWPEQVIAALRARNRHSKPTEFIRQIEALKQKSAAERDSEIEKLLAKAAKMASAPNGVDATLSGDEIVAMSRCGIQFGSHTYTHQILTTIPEDRAREEVGRSKSELEKMLRKPCTVFAYPNGNWSPETKRIVAEAGFTRAVTTERGAWMPQTDSLAIPRLNVCEDNIAGLNGKFWPPMFRYTVLWKAWCTMRRRPEFGRVTEKKSIGIGVAPALTSPRRNS